MNKLRISEYSKSVTLIFAVYFVCFLVGTYTQPD